MKKYKWLTVLIFISLALTLKLFTFSFQLNSRAEIPKEITISSAIGQAQNKNNQSSTDTTLRSLAKERGISIGTAVQARPLREDDTYQEVLAREFNLVTPENAMKFGQLHSQRDRYDFTNPSTIVNFAQANHMQVYGHTLVWHNNLPDWLKEKAWSRQELSDILREHIYTVVSRFRGQIVVWDVVNEAIENDGTLRKTIWRQGIGPEYIEMAFRWAHKADPQAKLFYNDYNGEGLGKKSDAIYALVKDLQQRGVPIHGVGFQMHTRIKNPPNPQKVAANIQRLGELGLEVRITEMDVQIYDGKGTREEKLAAQAEVYRDMLRVCLNAPNCKSFATWGLADHFSWIPYFFDRPDSPLLFDEEYSPKPGYDALVEELQGDSSSTNN
ncbi:MAG: endo-1,4-beta-xylanase [Symploca sp. SIO1B1]|nr:endo-1,4-beta-xylanase [Symploca sp. SIO1B1]